METKKRVVFICPKCQTISTTVHEIWKSEFVDDCEGLDKWGEIEKTNAGVGDSDSEFQFTKFVACEHQANFHDSGNCAIIISQTGSWKRYKEFDLDIPNVMIRQAIKGFLNEEKAKSRKKSRQTK